MRENEVGSRAMSGTAKIYDTAKVCDCTKLDMGPNTVIGDFCFISCKELVMLEGAQLNRYVEVSGRGRVVIGRYATVASHVSLLTSTDTPYGSMNDQAPDDQRRVKTGEIIIGNNAFIGQHSTLMYDVAIGDGTVVGANSFIAHDIPPWRICHRPRERDISVFRRLADGVKMANYPEELKALAEEEIVNRGLMR